MKAKVSERKKKEVQELTQLIKSEPRVGIIDLTSLPSAQFQKIKHKLRKDLKVRVAKKSLIKIAIEKAKESKKDIEKLEKYLEKGMPALIFTSEDAFKITKKLDKNKSSSPAKPGQMAPKDIQIEEGPTPFAPGPIIGELGQAGIKAAIEDGKVVVKEASTIVSKGEEISQKQSDLLAKFGIEPMEIGLNVVAIYQDGDIFTAEVLSIDDKEYLGMIKTAASEAINLAVYSAYPTKETIEILLQKAERESLALESQVPEESAVTEEPKEEVPQEEPKQEEAAETLKEEPKPEPQPAEESAQEFPEKTEEPKEKNNSDSQNEKTATTSTDPSGYTEDAEKQAQELINKLKDSNMGG